jgi:hypothetical protein
MSHLLKNYNAICSPIFYLEVYPMQYTFGKYIKTMHYGNAYTV